MFKMKWKKLMSYRVDLATDLIYIVILTTINYYIWSAFKPGVNVLAYILVLISLSQFSYRSTLNYVLGKYRSGAIIFDVFRPIGLERMVFWNWLGRSFTNVLIIGIFIVAVILNFNIFFLISMFLSIYARFLIGFISATIFYEAYYSWGPSNLLNVLTHVTGGGIPYFLMPEIVKKLMLFNPFFYVMAAPWVAARKPIIILFQVVLIVIMVLIAKFTSGRMIRNFTTVGV